jgi:hypothetical protein
MSNEQNTAPEPVTSSTDSALAVSMSIAALLAACEPIIQRAAGKIGDAINEPMAPYRAVFGACTSRNVEQHKPNGNVVGPAYYEYLQPISDPIRNRTTLVDGVPVVVVSHHVSDRGELIGAALAALTLHAFPPSVSLRKDSQTGEETPYLTTWTAPARAVKKALGISTKAQNDLDISEVKENLVAIWTAAEGINGGPLTLPTVKQTSEGKEARKPLVKFASVETVTSAKKDGTEVITPALVIFLPRAIVERDGKTVEVSCTVILDGKSFKMFNSEQAADSEAVPVLTAQDADRPAPAAKKKPKPATVNEAVEIA